MKLAVVVQRYGADTSGGAELHARYIAERLARHATVEVLTTCARDYVTWKNELPAGDDQLNGIRLRRFAVSRPRTSEAFGRWSDAVFHRPHSVADELQWLTSEGPSSLALIETLLQRRPHIQLLSSMQGQMGLDLARQHAPQLILLDVALPDVDGFNVLQRLRQSSITRAIPVLMITADASDLTHLALLEAGATAVLTKPIHIPSFLAHLDQHLPEPA